MTDQPPTRQDAHRGAETVAETEMVETPDGKGAWIRAWPSGHVHYSADWCSRRDGRIDTACGKTPIFWPWCYWPKAKICPSCLEASAEGAALLAQGSGVSQ